MSAVAPTLIILTGLPATGKTTIARALARQIGAVHLRIDTIERTLLNAGHQGPMDDKGYRIAFALAEDNLRLGQTVIADSVNPIQLTRDAWRDVAKRAGVRALDVGIACSDAASHRHRAEARGSDIAGHRLPTWNEIEAREFEPMSHAALVIDTAHTTLDDAVAQIRAHLGAS